ncbi:hypothetical protein [Comamonas sp. C24C]
MKRNESLGRMSAFVIVKAMNESGVNTLASKLGSLFSVLIEYPEILLS